MATATDKQGARPANLLLEAAMSVFIAANPLVSANKGADLGADFRGVIASAFNEFERIGFEMQLDHNMISEAKYALAAFVDEKVLASTWPHKTGWMGRPLQLEFFGEHLAGENFFQRLIRIRQGGERNIDLMEVYYTCLQLGFEGMYRLRGTEQLMALQVDLRSQIADCRSQTPRVLSPNGVPKMGFVEFVQREVPYWIIGVATVSVLLFAYLGFRWALNSQAEEARLAVQNDLQRIQTILPANMSMDADSRPVSEPAAAPARAPVRRQVRNDRKRG